MKIKKSDFYTSLFIIILFSQLYLPSFKVNVLLQFIVLTLFLFYEKRTLSTSFIKYITPIIVIFFIGFIGAFLHKNGPFDAVKDAFYFINPIIGLLIGYLFYKQIDDNERFFKTIILVGFISALIHVFMIVFISNHATVSDLRQYGKDNFLELFAIFFLKFYSKYKNKKLFERKLYFNIIFYTLLISCILYFSRTMIVVALILLASIHGYTKITIKSLTVIGVLLLLLFISFTYLLTIKLDRNGGSLESFLYKVQIAPSEILKTKIDRSNHAQLWDHWRGYESKRAFDLMNKNPSSYAFGCGHGSLVNLKFLAPITDNKKGAKYISILHNGYPYILYKTGFIGLFLYFVFLISFYIKIYKSNTLENVVISAIGITYFFTTLTITGIYNTSNIIILILGGLLFFSKKTNKLQPND